MAVPATRRERTYECCVGAFQGKFYFLIHLWEPWLRPFIETSSALISKVGDDIADNDTSRDGDDDDYGSF